MKATIRARVCCRVCHRLGLKATSRTDAILVLGRRVYVAKLGGRHRWHENMVNFLRNLAVVGSLISAPSTFGCFSWPAGVGLSSEAEIRECLSRGADANAKSSGATALHWAALGNNAPGIAALVEAGADLEGRTGAGATPLHWAAKYGNLAAIGALVRAGSSVSSLDHNGSDSVSWAARGESASELGVWVPPDDYAGNVTAHAVQVLKAADRKSAQAIKLLLRLGATANARDVDQGTALHEAARLGKAQAIRALCAHGADVGVQMQWTGATALHVVASRASGSTLPAQIAAGAIKELVEAGADVNTPLGQETPLRMLTRANNAAAVWVLLEAGAEVDARDAQGVTALHLASLIDGAGSLVQLLLEAGADVHARDADQSTPLHWAAGGDNAAAIRLLAEAGADVDARTGQDNRSAIDKALMNGSAAAIAALADIGADLGERGDEDFPLFWARTMERAALEAWKKAVRQQQNERRHTKQ